MPAAATRSAKRITSGCRPGNLVDDDHRRPGRARKPPRPGSVGEIELLVVRDNAASYFAPSPGPRCSDQRRRASNSSSPADQQLRNMLKWSAPSTTIALAELPSACQAAHMFGFASGRPRFPSFPDRENRRRRAAAYAHTAARPRGPPPMQAQFFVERRGDQWGQIVDAAEADDAVDRLRGDAARPPVSQREFHGDMGPRRMSDGDQRHPPLPRSA